MSNKRNEPKIVDKGNLESVRIDGHQESRQNNRKFPKEGFVKFLVFMIFVFSLGSDVWLNEEVLKVAIPALFIISSMNWFFDFLKYIMERSKKYGN